MVLSVQELFLVFLGGWYRRELFTAEESDCSVQSFIVVVGPRTSLLLDLVWKLRKMIVTKGREGKILPETSKITVFHTVLNSSILRLVDVCLSWVFFFFFLFHLKVYIA